MKYRNLLLWILLAFAFLIRVISISDYPPSLNWDEVSHGYNAYSLLKTGTDEWGEPYPQIFRAYGDYKLPVYIYLTIPSVAIFGLTPLAVRLPSILAGVIVVLFTYLLTQKLFDRKDISFFAAFISAIAPWSFFLSRVALEANVALALTLAGVYYFFDDIKHKNGNLIRSAVLLSLSVWTYNSYRFFTPLISLVLISIYHKELKKLFLKNKVTVVLSGIIFTFFISAMALQFLSAEGSARYDNVAIISEASIGQIEHIRNISQLPEIVTRVLYNRYTYFCYTFVSHFVSHFSTDFLFTSGGSNYQFNIQSHGLLFAITFPFITIGSIAFFLSRKYRKHYLFIVLWILAAPLAASLTKDTPHTLRTITFLPLPYILTAYGITYALDLTKKYRSIFTSIIVFTYLLYFTRYFITYTNEYTRNYSWAWQYGYEQAVDYAMTQYEKYDVILMTKKYGEPHEFVLFYSSWNPAEFKNDSNLVRFYQSDWYWTDRFDKFNFINDWDIPMESSDNWILESEEMVDISGKVLLITSPGNYPNGWHVLDTIHFLDGQAVFDIVEK